MEVKIELNNDPKILADLNKTVQDIHSGEYPKLFKRYEKNKILIFMQDVLAKDNWFSYVAVLANQYIGYALFFIKDYEENPFRKSYKAIHIDQICVMPDFQRKQIGSLLMKAIEDFAHSKDIYKLELTFWEKNIQAKQFYKKYGFQRMWYFVSKNI
jgi:GNAT superfamily N-acetyltransferase